MRSAVVVFIALASVAGLVNGDDCTPEDNNVQETLFAALQKQLKSSNAEYIALPDFSKTDPLFGLITVEWKGAKAGNLSSLALTKLPSGSSSSLCKTVNGNTVERKLSINFGFENLEASFEEFVITTPLFNIGGQNTGIGLSGDSLLVTVDTVTNNNTCTAKLTEFTFTSWGSLQLNLGSGIVNYFLEKIFNNYFNTMVLNFLQEFGVAGMVNNAVTTYAGQIIDASGQQATVCQLVNLLN
ncbi:hypothetical protein GE061_011173 [Apolygus lucorum]|uniref:Uncharacterized protein n=1 Tax=Apolygus lucorum TaxID=248454 RepID=A0A6A4K7S8_APOLU|nr:hypothetical protein GE061_011173 [Apolygus lucorum]